MVDGNDKDAYKSLPKYCDNLCRNNPGSKIILESIDEERTHRFSRVFVCYGAAAKGFAYCRPVLGLDGTHLKAKYKGILLCVTGVDANGSLFPLASAVVDVENNENWLWFIQLVHDVIEEHSPAFLDPQALSLVSDRQKGLVKGAVQVFPDSPHAYCLRHLYENMYKQFKYPKLKTFLWQATEATTEEAFNKVLAEINGIDPHALKWLLNHALPMHWAELYFPGRRYGHITSNITGALNSAILEAHEKLILAIFKHMHQHLMEWYSRRCEIDLDVPEGQIVVFHVVKRIQDTTAWLARRYHPISANDDNTEFEILSMKTNSSYTVKLEHMICTCFAWQSASIPCSHAVAAILIRK